jgi:microcompartment protein CcmK/EutM
VKLCRVKGNIVATVKLPAFHGHKLMIVQPLDEAQRDVGDSFIAIDLAQAGEGDVVLVLQEGNGARQLLRAPGAPIRSLIVGIVDAVDVDAKAAGSSAAASRA